VTRPRRRITDDHRLAGSEAIDPHDVAARRYQRVEDGSRIAVVIDDFLKRSISTSSRITRSTICHGSHWCASTRGIAFLPADARNFLPLVRDQSTIKGDAQ